MEINWDSFASLVLWSNNGSSCLFGQRNLAKMKRFGYNAESVADGNVAEDERVAEIKIEETIDEHFDRIYRAALILSGNPWDADDLAQETFMIFSSQIDRFEGRSTVYTYLYGILLNLDRRERRKFGTRNRKLRVVWENESQNPHLSPAAEAKLEVDEWKKSLWSWVEKLPNGQRQVLVLRFAEQLRYDEIAESLSIPVGTVKSRIFHGLATLRSMLDNRFDIQEGLRDFISRGLPNSQA